MRENHSSLLFVIDRSGSMSTMTDETIGGFNAVLEENKAMEGTADVTLVLFDHEFLRPAEHVDVKDVEPLDRTTYVPRGMTALLDAVGMSVTDEVARQEALAEDERPEKTIVTIITDGQENSSKEWTYAKVKELLEGVQKDRNWVVTFLGANIDVAKEATSLGIDAAMASAYVADGAGTSVLYQSVGNMQRAVRGMSAKKMASGGKEWREAVLDAAEESFADVRADYERRSGGGDGDDKGDGDRGLFGRIFPRR